MSYIPLLPGERVRLVFLFQDPTLFPSWESFWSEVIEDSRFEVRIYVTAKPEFSYESITSAQEFLSDRKIPFEILSISAIKAFNPHFMVYQTPYDYIGREVEFYSKFMKKIGIRIVYIPYGIEIVDTPSARYDHFRMPVIENAYRIYVVSEEMKKEYRKYCGNYSAVRATGLPRIDFITKGDFKINEDIRKKANGRKIIVWHSHFIKVSFVNGKSRQITPYIEDYCKFAERIKDYNDCFFVFLPHPKFGNDLSNSCFNEQSRKLLEIIENAENAYVDRSPDYRGTFFNADAILTDRSSLMIEAAFVDVPVMLWYNPDYMEDTITPLRPLTDSYDKGFAADDVFDFIESVRNNQDSRKKERHEALQRCIPYTDGKSGERIANDLYDVITTENTLIQNERKKIIIFGTGYLYKVISNSFDISKKADIVAFSDNNHDKWHTEFEGKQIIPPVEIKNMDFDKIVITVNELPAEFIYKQLRFDLEIPDKKIAFCEYFSEMIGE